MRRSVLTAAQFLLLACPAICLAQADGRWEFTRRELAECKRIELNRKHFPFSMIVPKTGYYRSATIYVEDRPYLSLAKTLLGSLSSIRDDAVDSGHRIVAFERNLLIVDTGPLTGHYFYCVRPGAIVRRDNIKSRADCLFRVKCAMSLQPLDVEEIHDKPIGSTARAGAPASTYPRLARRWSSKNGKHHLDAQLSFVQADGTGVEFRAAGGRVVSVSLDELDDASRYISVDARNYFHLERAMQGVLEAVDAGADATSRELDSAVSSANHSISRWPPKMRYRVIGVSAQLPPEHTRSGRGEFRLSLRPLYEFQTLRSVRGKKLKAEYLDHWYFPAESFSPDMVKVNQTILEVPGRPQINRETDPPAIHFQLTAEGEDSPLVWFGFDGGNPRLYTPGVGRATSAVETMFPAAAAAEELAEPPRPAEAPRPAVAREPERGPRASREVPRPPAPRTPTAESGERGTIPTIPTIPEIPRVNLPGKLAEKVRQARQQIKQQLADRLKEAGDDRAAAAVAGGDDKRIGVSGSRTKRSFEADGEDLGVSGFNNEVTISGKCRQVTISGTGNHVIVEEVASITMTGSGNVVQYVRGADGSPPKVRDVSRLNEVKKIGALPR
jgi:hypothetical protein